MCSAVIKLTSNALGEISNAETLLKIKGVIALFIQTMEVCDRLSIHFWRIFLTFNRDTATQWQVWIAFCSSCLTNMLNYSKCDTAKTSKA